MITNPAFPTRHSTYVRMDRQQAHNQSNEVHKICLGGEGNADLDSATGQKIQAVF